MRCTSVQISRNGGSCPSPSGRRWPEGPDEGAFPALTPRFAPPSPKGRGTPRHVVALSGWHLLRSSHLWLRPVGLAFAPLLSFFAAPRRGCILSPPLLF